MSDWADEKAREWIQAQAAARVGDIGPHLAALLREVKSVRADLERVRLLAEVRRVVETSKGAEVFCPCDSCHAWDAACDEILSRLEKL